MYHAQDMQPSTNKTWKNNLRYEGSKLATVLTTFEDRTKLALTEATRM